MKKVTLSAMAALLVSGAAYADTLTLYTDTATGQVYTTPGEGRVEMGDFVDAKTVYLENQAQDSKIAKAKAKKEKKGYVPVKAKASKLQFSGKHYLGYKYIDRKEVDGSLDNSKNDWSGFETRRNYFQVKAYMFDNKKSYMRVTMDTYQNLDSDSGAEKQGAEQYGRVHVQLKYAFLYLDNILPYTGVEFGQVHRPWIDYEEHQGWWYRSISKVFVEASESADLTNSADMGINFKTKLPYFTSEIGLFNGEGYHQEETGGGNSLEWRLTAVLTGNGEKKRKVLKDTYWDVSFFGQHQEESGKVGERDTNLRDGYDYKIYGLHTVYNQPEFLLSAQYVKSTSGNDGRYDTSDTNYKQGEGYSINGTYRFGSDKQFGIIGRYDRWDDEKGANQSGVYTPKEKEYWIAGAYYDYNKNVRMIANVLNTTDNMDNETYKDSKTYMFTAEVSW